jgi:hypothetical protein
MDLQMQKKNALDEFILKHKIINSTALIARTLKRADNCKNSCEFENKILKFYLSDNDKNEIFWDQQE